MCIEALLVAARLPGWESPLGDRLPMPARSLSGLLLLRCLPWETAHRTGRRDGGRTVAVAVQCRGVPPPTPNSDQTAPFIRSTMVPGAGAATGPGSVAAW
jgi:hypothetical protein